MGLALKVETELVTETCITCGCSFAFPQDLQYALKRSKQNFHCPSGHPQHYTGESDAERAARIQRELEAERMRHNMTRASLEQEKKKKARLQKRVKAGVCPCCNRSFQALGRHMATKHPDYAEPNA